MCQAHLEWLQKVKKKNNQVNTLLKSFVFNSQSMQQKNDSNRNCTFAAAMTLANRNVKTSTLPRCHAVMNTSLSNSKSIPSPKMVKVFGNNRILNPTTAHRSLYLNTFFSRKHELRELSSLLWQCCMFCARVATPAPTLPRVAKNNATRIWLRTACCWSR